MYILVRKEIRTGEKSGSARCGTCSYCIKKHNDEYFWWECSLFNEHLGIDVMGKISRCDECFYGERDMQILEDLHI